MTPIRYRGEDCLSFKQLDSRDGLPKGGSFRRFKRQRDGLEEGRDFFLLDHAGHAEQIEDWRRAGLIYAGTVNLVLITASGDRKLRGAL